MNKGKLALLGDRAQVPTQSHRIPHAGIGCLNSQRLSKLSRRRISVKNFPRDDVAFRLARCSFPVLRARSNDGGRWARYRTRSLPLFSLLGFSGLLHSAALARMCVLQDFLR
jgi:hypothetical protein